MNAVTPKPNPQDARLIFTLISPFSFFVITNLITRVTLKNTCMPMPGAAGAAGPQRYRDTCIPGPRECTCCRSKRAFQANKQAEGDLDFSRLWIILEEAVGEAACCLPPGTYRSQAPMLRAQQNISMNDKMSEVSYLLGPAQGMSLRSGDSHLQDTLLFLQHSR